MRRGVIVVLVALCAALVVAGCGGSSSDGSDDMASLVPADAPVYLESVVRPEGAQADAIKGLTSSVGGIDDPGGAIVSQIDAALSDSGADATYANDIEPWLGERAAVFFSSLTGSPPDFGIVIQTTDTGAAQDFLDKATGQSSGTSQENYNGVDYLQSSDGSFATGIVGDFLVFGSVTAFKAAVDASNGSSLADSSDFQDGVAGLPTDNLGLGYADAQQAIDAVLASGQIDPLQAQALKPLVGALATGPVTFSVSGTTDSASVDVSVPVGSNVPAVAGGSLLSQAPADSWLALGVQDLGQVLQNSLDQAAALPGISDVEAQVKQQTGLDVATDVLPWMGDAYAFLSGTSQNTLTGAVVIQSSDSKASANAINTLKGNIQLDPGTKLGPALSPADAGFSISSAGSPEKAEFDSSGDQVVGAVGPGQPAKDALSPAQKLADDPSFQSATGVLGSDFSPTAYLSLAPFFVVAEKGGSANDPQYLAAKPYLEKLDYLILGTRTDGDRAISRFAVGVK